MRRRSQGNGCALKYVKMECRSARVSAIVARFRGALRKKLWRTRIYLEMVLSPASLRNLRED